MDPSIDTGAQPGQPAPDRPQSGIGIASFVLAVLCGVATIGVFGYAGYVEVTTSGGVGANETVATLIGLGILACGAALLVGLILGIVALFQRNRRRVFAAIGVGLNGLFVVLISLMMWIGMMQE